MYSSVTSRRCLSKRSSSASSALRHATPRQPLGQIDRIVDAAVHAHAAERVVDVGGVADQEGAAELKVLATR